MYHTNCYSKSQKQQWDNYLNYIVKYRSKFLDKLSDLCLETYCLFNNKTFTEIHGLFHTPNGFCISLRHGYGVSVYRVNDLDLYSLKNIVYSLKKEFGRV